jgi:hypothetical protein
LVPAVSAASTTNVTWDFTSAKAPAGVPGNYQLSSSPHAGNGVNVTGFVVYWTLPTALRASGSLTAGTFTANLAFQDFGGNAYVFLGYFLGGTFHQLASGSAPIQQAAIVGLTNPIGPVGSSPALYVPLHVIASGSASVAVQISQRATIPQGAYWAIGVSSDHPNYLEVQSALIGSQSGSSATVPMPELPAAVLIPIGLVGLVGVAKLRRRL